MFACVLSNTTHQYGETRTKVCMFLSAHQHLKRSARAPGSCACVHVLCVRDASCVCVYACCAGKRGHLCPEWSCHCGCWDLTDFRQVTQQRDMSRTYTHILTRAELTVSANKDQPQSEPSCYRHPWHHTYKHSQCQLLETPPTYEHSSVEIRIQLPNKQQRISKP